MLYLNSSMKPPSIDMRVEIMRKHINKGGVPIDYDRLIEYNIYSKMKQAELGAEINKLCGVSGDYFDKQSFKSFLLSNGLTEGLSITPTGSYSLSKDSIQSFIDTNAYGEGIQLIAKKYQEWNNYGAIALLLPNIINSCKLGMLSSEDGRRVVLLKPKVEPQNTGRFGYKDPAIQNLPRIMKDLYLAPKGWKYISADSAQVEPKIVYTLFIKDKQIQTLIDLYGDAYIGVLHYCLMDEEYIKNKTLNFTRMEITDEIMSFRSQLKTYNNGVMYGSTSNRENSKLKQNMIQRIGGHPDRIKWFNEAKRKFLSGYTYADTVFGTKVDILKSDKYLKAQTDKERELAIDHCLINNPIQGTAADLMGFSLAASDRLIEKNAPNSWICKFVHDDGGYVVHESEYDYVAEELLGNTSYNINNEVVITNDPVTERHMSYVPSFIDGVK